MLFRKARNIKHIQDRIIHIYGVCIHVDAVCSNCGNECWQFPSLIAVYHPKHNRTVKPRFDWDESICESCLNVMEDYDRIYDYDEFDDDDEYTYTCEICGGEIGEGWSTCCCNDDEVYNDDEEVFVHTCPPAHQMNCKHVWDGPWAEEANMSTATCSKCGMWAIDYSMWYGP